MPEPTHMRSAQRSQDELLESHGRHVDYRAEEMTVKNVKEESEDMEIKPNVRKDVDDDTIKGIDPFSSPRLEYKSPPEPKEPPGPQEPNLLSEPNILSGSKSVGADKLKDPITGSGMKDDFAKDVGKDVGDEFVTRLSDEDLEPKPYSKGIKERIL